jgi:hypothetical protein
MKRVVAASAVCTCRLEANDCCTIRNACIMPAGCSGVHHLYIIPIMPAYSVSVANPFVLLLPAAKRAPPALQSSAE